MSTTKCTENANSRSGRIVRERHKTKLMDKIPINSDEINEQ